MKATLLFLSASLFLLMGADGGCGGNGATDAGAPSDATDNGGEVTDGDGNIYSTVTLGGLEWMAENLRVAQLSDGTAIEHVTDNSRWGLSLTTPAYGFYDNASSNGDTYGAFYNGHAVATGALCPTGWRVPTRADWSAVMDAFGEDAGGALKTTELWASPNSGATNESGFSAVPGGWRNYVDGGSYQLGEVGNYWSSTENPNGPDSLFFYTLGHDNARVDENINSKAFGYSVRCVRDSQRGRRGR